MVCENCGKTMTNGTAVGSFYCNNCGNYENSQIQKDKVYTLAYNNTKHDHSEQTTYLIDEDKKIKMIFFTDGYEGTSAKDVKGILNFLGIKYFECVYGNGGFPEKYRKYKTYFMSGEEAPDFYY